MIYEILKFFGLRARYDIRVSPHTKKVEITPVKYLEVYDSDKHKDDEST